MVDSYTLSVILFIFIIGFIIYKKRKKIEMKNYIFFIWRTKRFKKIIDKIANISPRFWTVFSTFGLVICIIFMFYGLFLLINTANLILTGIIKEPALRLILPTPSPTEASIPGVILIPFWHWLVIIFSILTPHELSHGIIARSQKIKLESVGLLLFAIFPGAFVEPDEKQLKKAKTMKRLRIYGAGSFANFTVALLLILLINFMIWPSATSPGIYLTEIIENSPAELAGLKPNTTITHVNGKVITTTYFESISGKGFLSDEIEEPEAGDTLKVIADGEEYNVELDENPETKKTYMGITYTPVTKNWGFFAPLIQLLNMIWLFSFAVAVVNILPLYPLDGGLIVEALTEKYFKRKSKKIVKTVSYATLLLILFSFFGPYLIGL